jgi:hypothetical protein
LFSQRAYLGSVDTLFPATFAMGVFACGLGLFDTLTLTFSQDIPFEFRKAAQDIKKQFGERVMVVSGERQVFLHELNGNAFCDQLADDVLQFLEAAGKPVDGVDPQGVAFVQTGEAVLKLWSVSVFTGSLLFIDLPEIDLAISQLANCILLMGAHPDVSYVASVH